MEPKLDLDVIEAADVTALSIEERAAAFFKGTVSIYRLMEQVVCPVVQGQVGKSDYESAVAGTYYRCTLLLRGLTELNDPAHFQIVNSVARTVFELLLDLKVLVSDPAMADKYFAFSHVAKFRKATQLKEFLDANPDVDQTQHLDAIKFASDAKRRVEVERDCILHWGTDRRGNPRWPDHWSGKNIADRANDAGLELAEIYRSQFFLQSYYVHAGPAGVQNLSREALIYTFGLAHRLVQRLAAMATQIVADEFHLFSTDLELLKKLTRVSAAAGFYAVESLLEQQRAAAAEDGETQ